MSVESKIKFRIYAFLGAALVVLAFIVGVVYAFLIALLAFLSWKAYTYSKAMRWWKAESPISRQIMEFVLERLNEGRNSKNGWVYSLTLPEMAQFEKEYRVELMARPTLIERESANLIEGWTEWGATRLDDCVLRLSVEELAKNVGGEENPIPMMEWMVSKASLETLVAEYALALLNVSNPQESLSRRSLAIELDKLNKSEDMFARTAYAEKSALAFSLFAKVHGEETQYKKVAQ